MELDGRRWADFDPGLRKGQILTNEEIEELFECGTEGSMRCSLATNSLILITGDSLGPYRDRWEGELFHFTGRGLRGDQDLEEGPNHALAESGTTDVTLFHIDNPQGDRYVYTGRVKLAAQPCPEQQPDELGRGAASLHVPARGCPQPTRSWSGDRRSSRPRLNSSRRSHAWPRFVGWVKDTIGVRD